MKTTTLSLSGMAKLIEAKRKAEADVPAIRIKYPFIVLYDGRLFYKKNKNSILIAIPHKNKDARKKALDKMHRAVVNAVGNEYSKHPIVQLHTGSLDDTWITNIDAQFLKNGKKKSDDAIYDAEIFLNVNQRMMLIESKVDTTLEGGN